MKRRIQFASLLLAGAIAAFGADQKAASEKPAQPLTEKVPKGGIPGKAGIPKGADRVINPENPAARLFRMSPEEREHAISALRPRQQENAWSLLKWFDSLPRPQQLMQLRRLDRFERLTPEKKRDVAQALVQVRDLEPPRRRQVAVALFQLQNMPDAQRELTLRRPGFIRRFTPEELRLINSLADAWMGPPQQPQ